MGLQTHSTFSDDTAALLDGLRHVSEPLTVSVQRISYLTSTRPQCSRWLPKSQKLALASVVKCAEEAM
jgi:hypothetical protein